MAELPKMRFAPDLLPGKIALVTDGGTGMDRAAAIVIDAVKYARRERGDGNPK
jgi:hypothetical protein